MGDLRQQRPGLVAHGQVVVPIYCARCAGRVSPAEAAPPVLGYLMVGAEVVALEGPGSRPSRRHTLALVARDGPRDNADDGLRRAPAGTLVCPRCSAQPRVNLCKLADAAQGEAARHLALISNAYESLTPAPPPRRERAIAQRAIRELMEVDPLASRWADRLANFGRVIARPGALDSSRQLGSEAIRARLAMARAAERHLPVVTGYPRHVGPSLRADPGGKILANRVSPKAVFEARPDGYRRELVGAAAATPRTPSAPPKTLFGQLGDAAVWFADWGIDLTVVSRPDLAVYLEIVPTKTGRDLEQALQVLWERRGRQPPAERLAG